MCRSRRWQDFFLLGFIEVLRRRICYGLPTVRQVAGNEQFFNSPCLERFYVSGNWIIPGVVGGIISANILQNMIFILRNSRYQFFLPHKW